LVTQKNAQIGSLVHIETLHLTVGNNTNSVLFFIVCIICAFCRWYNPG